LAEKGGASRTSGPSFGAGVSAHNGDHSAAISTMQIVVSITQTNSRSLLWRALPKTMRKAFDILGRVYIVADNFTGLTASGGVPRPIQSSAANSLERTSATR
jgi:hypothetical protein